MMVCTVRSSHYLLFLNFDLRNISDTSCCVNIGRRIVDYSRIPVSQYINEFDIFYFAEDDMILSYNLLTAWYDFLPTCNLSF